ncbi:MAG: hypothetical protein R3D59_09230 [Paracoccaceae bacterium]
MLQNGRKWAPTSLIAPQYTNWMEEVRAHNTAVLLNQSYHT